MRFIQKQFRSPSGFFGRVILPRLWNRWNHDLHEVAFRVLDIQPDDRILEIGFGGGSLLKRIHPLIPKGNVAGVDHSPAVCRYCSKRFAKVIRSGRLGLMRGRAEGLPFRGETYTQVFSVNSIFYWNDIPQALSEIGRVLRKGGRCILIFTAPDSLKDRPAIQDAVKPVTPSEISNSLSDVGFRDIHISEHTDPHRMFYTVIARKSTKIKE